MLFKQRDWGARWPIAQLLGAGVMMLFAAACRAQVQSALTQVNFNGSSQAFTNKTGWTPNIGPNGPNGAGYLADVTNIPQTAMGANNAISVSSNTAITSFTLGALVFDATGSSSSVKLNATNLGANPTAETLNLAGGDMGTTASPVSAANDLLTLTNNFSGKLDMQGDNGGLVINVSTAGNFDISPSSTIECDNTVTSGITYATTLAGSGTISITGGGTLSLQNADPNLTGGLIVSNGTVVASAGGCFGTASVQIFGGVLSYQGLDSSLGSAHVFTVNNANSTINVAGTHWANVYALSQNSGATGSLTKTGTGTFSIQTGGTYGGTTNVFGGALFVMNSTGNGVGGGAVTVGDGGSNAGIFGGSGTVTSPVTVNANGTLCPATISVSTVPVSVTGPGTFVVSKTSLTLQSGATMMEKIGPTSNDIVSVMGTGSSINIANASTINIQLINSGGIPSPNAQYVLFQFGSRTAENFTFANLTFNVTSATNGYDPSFAQIGYDPVGNDIYLTGVPEPSAVPMAALAGSSLLARRRPRSDSRFPKC